MHQFSRVTQEAESFKQAMEDAQRTGTATNWSEAVVAALNEIDDNAMSATTSVKDFSDALNGLFDPRINLVKATDAWDTGRSASLDRRSGQEQQDHCWGTPPPLPITGTPSPTW